MDKENPKSALLDLALEIGKGETPRDSWLGFLEKLRVVSRCSGLSVWRLNPPENKLYLSIFLGQSPGLSSPHLTIENVEFENDLIRLEYRQLSKKYRQIFSSAKQLLILIKLDGSGMLAVEDPGFLFDRADVSEAIVRICKRQAVSVLQLEKYQQLAQRNRKKLQIIQKLRDWRGIYANLFENINDAILVINTDNKGVITNANRVARKLLGFSKSDLKNICLKDFLPENSTDNFEYLIQCANESGKVTNFEWNFRSSQGNIVHCLVNCSAIRADDVVIAYLISLHDITRRKKAESLLERVHQIQDQVLNNLPVGVILTNMKGEIISVNAHFFELLTTCKSVEELSNFKYEDHFKNPDKEREKVARLLEKMEPVTNDIVFLKNGKIVSRDFIPISFEGEVISKLWTFKDITEPYQALLELEASEQRYRGVIENLSLGIVEWSADKKVVAAYPSFLRIVGVDPVKILGKSANDIFRSKSDIFQQQDVGHAIEVELQMPETATKWMLISTVPVFEHDNELRGYMSVLYDITERKKMEEELRNAQKSALESRDYERYFLANMSHEIRTPLNAIAGMTHLLRNTNLSNTQRQYVDSLESSTNSLLHLLNDLLDISKIEAGQMELEEREFSLKALCENLTLTYQAKIKGKPVHLMLQFDKRINRAVIGDSVRIQQILGNLLSNACKFTHEGAIVLEIHLVENKSDAYHVKFAVHDTGVGISAEKQKLIFEKFKQADAATGNDYGGTGLGLSIVKQLVELHGGFIEVESKEGEGASFSFIIDLKKSTTLATTIENAVKKEKRVGKELQEGSFLIVDDNPTNLKLMAKLFELWGCRYELAMSGKEALVKTRNNKFDLILMDMRMPGMDGCEATRKIRNDALNNNRHTPIVALSAAILPDDRKQALMAGMDDFMPKPFSPSQLLECLHRHLKFRLNRANRINVSADPGAERPQKSLLGQPVPNLDYLFEFSNGDKAFVKDLLATFLDDAPRAIRNLENLLAHGKHLEAANILHRFKPNFQTLGLIDLKNDAIILENELKETSSTDPENLMRMCSPFIGELKRAISYLRRSLNEL